MTSIFDQFEERKTGFDEVDTTANSKDFPEYLKRMADDLATVKSSVNAMLEPRPGQRILDVGCGTGVDVLALAERIVPGGRVVGMDNSTVMIDTAREQAADRDLAVEFGVGDAHRLPFDDDSFDAVRAERVLQHVADQTQVGAELVRVAKPGGRVLIADLDHGMWAPDLSDRETTRLVLSRWFDYIANPWAGRQSARQLRAAGVVDTAVTVLPVTITALEAADAMTGLGRAASLLAAAGVVDAERAGAWDEELRARDADGSFLMCGAMLVTCGRAPENVR